MIKNLFWKKIFPYLLSIILLVILFVISNPLHKSFDPMTGFVNLLSKQESLSSRNFDFSPDGQAIVFLDSEETTLTFIDLSGKVEKKIEVEDILSELISGVDMKFRYLQWYAENKLSFIYVSETANILSGLYSFDISNLTLELIYSHDFKIRNYCWSNHGNTLFMVVQDVKIDQSLLAINRINNLSDTYDRSFVSWYISCDKESPMVITSSGEVFEYDYAISVKNRLPTQDNLYISNFNAQNNSFYAVKKLGNSQLSCLAFEKYDDLKEKKPISNHSGIKKFVVSEESQSLIVETGSFKSTPRLHLLKVQTSNDGVYESPDLTRNGCGFSY